MDDLSLLSLEPKVAKCCLLGRNYPSGCFMTFIHLFSPSGNMLHLSPSYSIWTGESHFHPRDCLLSFLITTLLSVQRKESSCTLLLVSSQTHKSFPFVFLPFPEIKVSFLPRPETRLALTLFSMNQSACTCAFSISISEKLAEIEMKRTRSLPCSLLLALRKFYPICISPDLTSFCLSNGIGTFAKSRT